MACAAAATICSLFITSNWHEIIGSRSAAPSIRRKLREKAHRQEFTVGSRHKHESAVAGHPRRETRTWATQQTCHLLGDGTEICTYDGPLCVDPSDWSVHVGAGSDFALDAGGRNLSVRERYAFAGDAAYKDFDPRYGIYTGDSVGKNVRNPTLPAPEYQSDIVRDPETWAHAGRALQAPYGYRRWGPTARSTTVRETPWQAIAAATSVDDAARLGPGFASALSDADRDFVQTVRDKGQYRIFDWRGEQVSGVLGVTLPDRITWMDGAGWLLQAENSWLGHPWHFATSAFQLWAAKQANASFHEPPPTISRFGGHNPGFRLQMGGFAFPSIDSVVFLGSYKEGKLSEWARFLWPLLAQNHTRVLFNRDIRDVVGQVAPGSSHWVCFKRGALASLKWRLFSSVHDAASFRVGAYALANVTAPPHAAYPPRSILVLDRGVRGIANVSGLMADLRAMSGLPVQRLMDGQLLKLTMAQRVALFAGVGILVSPHGGQLSNIAFMRPKAVVIELLPFLTHGAMYREIGKTLDLHYYQVKTLVRPRQEDAASLSASEQRFVAWAVFDKEYVSRCDNAANKSGAVVSGPEAASATGGRRCAAGKDTYAQPDRGGLLYALASALDDIGCRDGVCHDIDSDAHVDMRAAASAAAASAAAVRIPA